MIKKRKKPNWVVKLTEYLSGTENRRVNRTALWTMLLAIFTLIILIFGYIELQDFRRNRNAEFLFNVNKDFFTPETREMIMLLEKNLIEFNNPYNDTAYGFPENTGLFIINKNYKGVTKCLLDTNRTLYTSYEVDDFILSKLDFIGQYEKNSNLFISDINDVFIFYFDVTSESKAIKDYLNWLAIRYPESDYYKDFRSVNLKLKNWEKSHPKQKTKK